MMLRLLLLLSSLLATGCFAGGAPPPSDQGPTGLRIGVLFNNVPSAPGLGTAWGFAAVIEGFGQTLLFDTGGDGELLLANMGRMGVDPDDIDAVLLSHMHGDHVRGLGSFLRRNPNVTVFMPASFPREFRGAARESGARVVPLQSATKLFGGVYSTGPMGHAPQEQALILDTAQGLVILTGCAHPGIVEIVREAKRRHARPIRLVMGGFHLLRQPERQIRATIGELAAKATRAIAVSPAVRTAPRLPALKAPPSPGDKEKGNINTPLEPAIRNEIDRFRLAIDVINRVERLQVAGAHVKERPRDLQIDCRNYAYACGIGKPEVADWTGPY